MDDAHLDDLHRRGDSLLDEERWLARPVVHLTPTFAFTFTSEGTLALVEHHWSSDDPPTMTVIRGGILHEFDAPQELIDQINRWVESNVLGGYVQGSAS